MPSIKNLIISLSIISLVGFGLFGCQPGVRKRPVGYLRVGKYLEIPMGVTYRPDLLLVLRRDIDGISAMSTACTYDLSPLTLKSKKGENGADEQRFFSSYTDSVYSIDGDVINGPAKAALPYYQLVLREGTYDGARDTVFVKIGHEVDRSWRLSDD